MSDASSMTRCERVMTALAGGVPDRVPVALSSIAFSNRYAGYKYMDALLDPEKHVEAQLKVLRDLQTDAVWGTHGLSAFAVEALGGNVVYHDDNPPSPGAPAILAREFEPFDASLIQSAGRVPIALRAIRILKKAVGPGVPVIALSPSPLMLADRLRGSNNFFRDFIRDPQFAHAVLEACVPFSISLGVSAIEAGADALWVAEPLGGATVISKKHYRDYAFAHNRRAFSALRDNGAKIVYHVCGDWNDRLELAADGVDCLHLAVEADMARVKSELGHRVSLMGNVRAVDFVFGTPEVVEQGVARCLATAKQGGGYILSGDCGLPRDTLVENVRAAVDTVRRLGTY